MCSVIEDDLDFQHLNLERKTKSNLKKLICKKCSEERAAVVLRTKDPYCRDCFLKNTTHKFRATLGKSKIVRPNDRILLATSGSLSSVALLHLVSEGLSEQNNKRFLFTSLAVYIDEGAILNLSNDERMDAIDIITKQAEDLGFPLYLVQLSSSLKVENIHLYCLTSHSQTLHLNDEELLRDDKEFKKIFTSVKSLTAKEDLLSKLRHKLLRAAAHELKCNKILLGENGSQLAVQLMTNISLGRGANLPLDVGFCDTRDESVMILRPLKELMSKEVAFYCVFCKLKTVTLPSLSTKTSRMASIRRLSEDFLFGLNVDFPSTLSTVIKTGDKLAVRKDGCHKCILCKAYIEQKSRDSSSQQATQYSLEVVHQIRVNAFRPSEGKMEENDNKKESLVPRKESRPLAEGHAQRKLNPEEHLCYGCRLTVIDMSDADEFIGELMKTNTNSKINIETSSFMGINDKSAS